MGGEVKLKDMGRVGVVIHGNYPLAFVRGRGGSVDTNSTITLFLLSLAFPAPTVWMNPSNFFESK